MYVYTVYIQDICMCKSHSETARILYGFGDEVLLSHAVRSAQNLLAKV